MQQLSLAFIQNQELDARVELYDHWEEGGDNSVGV